MTVIKNIRKRLRPLRRGVRYAVRIRLGRGRPKYFCIGQNKTGTTSLQRAFEELGYIVGNQRDAERLLPHYRDGDWDQIIRYCQTAEVFQDFPFSFPETYKHLDEAFPGSRFILTVRDSPEQWYESRLRFDMKSLGLDRVPTRRDFEETNYVWKGWRWEGRCLRFGNLVPDHDLYNRDILIKAYTDYNDEVLAYFKARPDDLLVINVAEEGSYGRFCAFLGKAPRRADFPWANRTNVPVSS